MHHLWYYDDVFGGIVTSVTFSLFSEAIKLKTEESVSVLDDRNREDSRSERETRNSDLTESAEPFAWTQARYAIPARTHSAAHKNNQQGNN